MKLFFRAIILLGFIVPICSSCMIREEYHGREVSAELLLQLKINKSTKEEVVELLGNPSSVSTFDDNIWYYLSLTKKGVSVFKPDITSQKSVQLRFKNDMLIDIKTYEDGKARSFDFNKQETKVEGNNHTAVQDFFHNLGRYNKEPGNKH